MVVERGDIMARLMPVMAVLLLVTGDVAAGPTAATKCQAQKLVVAGQTGAGLLHCVADAARHGVGVDAACRAHPETTLLATYAALESGGTCGTTGEAATVEADVQQMVNSVSVYLRLPASPSGCSFIRERAVARLASSVFNAYARNAKSPDPVAPGNATVRARARFVAVFQRAGAHGDCLSTDDVGVVDVPQNECLRVMGRLFPSCGDGVQGGTEECDLADAAACPLQCQPDCRCPYCGDGKVDVSGEECDGPDSARCSGLCQANCTCPPPVCGNGIREIGEVCDGSDAAACPGACRPDCTCTGSLCGDGVLEAGEQCDGNLVPLECAMSNQMPMSCVPPGQPLECTCCVPDGQQCVPGFRCCDSEGCYLVAPQRYQCAIGCVPPGGPCTPTIPCCNPGTCFPTGPDTGICQ
jgi:hypothetical protein